MAIQTEYVTQGNRTLIKHKSDAGKFLVQLETGAEYAEAVDVIPCPYTYKESEREIGETAAAPEVEEDELTQAYNILTGVSE